MREGQKMIPCNSCSGESIRITGEQKQSVAGCTFCTAVTLVRMGIMKNPEKHCGCYAKNPAAHNKNHKDTKMLGHQFAPLTEEVKEMEKIPNLD